MIFLDTNVLVYFAVADPEKFDQARYAVMAGGVVSIQVLSEFIDVLRRKSSLQWPAIEEALTLIRDLLDVRPMTIEMHELSVALARRHNLRIYDAMIVAAALLAECDTLYSEDMHSGLVVDGRLRIVNPFAMAS